jgi:hypothetical protein
VDENTEGRQLDGDAAVMRAAVAYGAAFGLGFSATMALMLTITAPNLVARGIALWLVVPVQSVLAAAVVAKLIGSPDAARTPWSSVLLAGGVLGGVAGFVCLVMLLADQSLRSSPNAWVFTLPFGAVGAIVGVLVGALAAAVLAWLVSTPREHEWEIPVSGLVLGVALGALVTLAMRFGSAALMQFVAGAA